MLSTKFYALHLLDATHFIFNNQIYIYILFSYERGNRKTDTHLVWYSLR